MQHTAPLFIFLYISMDYMLFFRTLATHSGAHAAWKPSGTR